MQVKASLATAQPVATLRALAQVARPQQWIKNLVCFAGLLFSGHLFEPAMVFNATLAFFGFCLSASAVYLMNDWLDRHQDRLNPRTAQRPFATGTLSLWLGGVVFCVLLICAGLIAFALDRMCFIVWVAYVVMNVGYSLRLKQTVIVDVICIALGFIFRVLFGVYAIHVVPSPWIVLCMFFLALFLGFGKRKGELDDLPDGAQTTRAVLRKYTADYLDMVLGITATMTILTYTLYTVSAAHDPTIVITIFPVVYCLLRYTHQVIVEGRGQSPEALLFRDKMMWIGVAMWAVLCMLVLYGGLKLVEFPHP